MTAPKVCVYCGAYLDAGERCECEEEEEETTSLEDSEK